MTNRSDRPLTCRKRGRLVLVGVAGLNLSRADFYEKELSFQVSCSYGPGRYDPAYEQQGQDYPIGYVRWTEQRNFEAVLDMMQSGQLTADPLITHRFDLDNAADAYALISSDTPSLGVMLQYRTPAQTSDEVLRQTVVGRTSKSVQHGSQQRTDLEVRPTETVRVAFLGAGSFATSVLIPAFQQHGAHLAMVASRGGLTGTIADRKFKFDEVTSDTDAPFNNPDIDAIVIATRHDSHADLVCRALDTGKHVFVEKPLALNTEQLDAVLASAEKSSHTLTVGFNRRFAPHIQRMRTVLAGAKEAKAFVMTVNAGMIPADHWVHDPIAGGGRIIGEGCHFVDLLRFLCGHPITQVQATMFGRTAPDDIHDDRMTFTLAFADGSIGTVHYLANGHKAVPKERLEVFCGGRVMQLDNFRKLRGYGWPSLSKMNLWRQDKGHANGVKAFLDAIRTGGPPPIPLDELAEVSRVTLDIVRAAETRETIVYDGSKQAPSNTSLEDTEFIPRPQPSLAD
ncbi:MAG: Gfo/Idh/MocA family oxidoreductase [Planctomycetaceae bacterium]